MPDDELERMIQNAFEEAMGWKGIPTNLIPGELVRAEDNVGSGAIGSATGETPSAALAAAPGGARVAPNRTEGTGAPATATANGFAAPAESSAAIANSGEGIGAPARATANSLRTLPLPAQSGEASRGRDVASAIFKNALGMAPLARLVAGLFGGGNERIELSPLVKYSAPAPLRLEAANARPGANGRLELAGVDYGQDGLRRAATWRDPASAMPASASEPQIAGYTRAAPAGAAPQIQIHVQAMDSRSFLDHSHEIARAVREAMLNTHSLNDVITEL